MPPGPAVFPLMCPREMMVPPLVMARVISSALAPLPSRIAREPRSSVDPGVAMTTLLNRATEFTPFRFAVG